jgi:integrase/recombinase XerD
MSTVIAIAEQKAATWQEAALFVRNTLCLNTKRDYAAEVRLFAGWIQKPAHAVMLGDLLSYREHLEARGLKPATVVKKLTVLRRLFAFCHDQGLLPRNPAAGLVLPKVNDESGRDIFTLDECRKLLDAIDPITLRGKRDKAILALLLINGLRTCEIVRANIGDLRREEDYWVLRVRGKGGREADTRIRDDVHTAIAAYASLRGDLMPEAPLFTGTNHRAKGRLTTRTVQHMVKGHMQRAGIERPNLCVHSLRHTAVTLVILSGASILKAQEFARHSDPKTTTRYFHNLERMKDHAVLLHPLYL